MQSTNHLEAMFRELDQVWLTANRKAQVEKVRAASQGTKSYVGGEYGLKLGFQTLLGQLNDYLPSQMRFPRLNLPKDASSQSNEADAKTIVDALIYENDRLIQSQGLKDYADLERLVAGSGSKTVRDTYEILKSENVEFKMNRPSRGRFWIEHTGFQNQHVTGSSGGFKGKMGRNAAEATYLNTEYEAYAKAHDDLKPKYGMLEFKDLSKFSDASAYGDDAYTFKKESVAGRVTFTLGDSLNAMSGMGRMMFLTGKTEAATKWDHVFTPWERRAQIAPFVVAGERLGQVSADHNIPLARAHQKTEYVELQFWGPLNLDHVETFTFTGSPPNGTFLKA
ncbi:MAG: hypothetical protein EOP09_18385, partial [Proteobacteria bacterium]